MTVQILVGDCREKLRELPEGVFHTCITSPAYYGLRDYGHPDQIGLEDTPEAYVEAMVDVFREVRRVLRDDGTLWLNLGDSYASAPGQATRGGPPSKSSTLEGNGHRGGGPKLAKLPRVGGSGNKGNSAADHARRPFDPGLKPKDLIGIPWRVAFALQADGWYLRQDIIWAKPNPMPESVQDRCTKAHEYLFLLSKSARYYYDAEAIAEPLGAASIARLAQNVDFQAGSDRVPGRSNGAMKAVGRRRAPGNRSHKCTAAYQAGAEEHRTKEGLVAYADRQRAAVEGGDLTGTRNKRSVWSVATTPFKEAHFATYPLELIEPCILAGSPGGGLVIDPFGGAGTTALAASRLGRDCTLIEVNPEYAAMADRRLRAGLCQVATPPAEGDAGPLFDGAAA